MWRAGNHGLLINITTFQTFPAGQSTCKHAGAAVSRTVPEPQVDGIKPRGYVPVKPAWKTDRRLNSSRNVRYQLLS